MRLRKHADAGRTMDTHNRYASFLTSYCVVTYTESVRRRTPGVISWTASRLLRSIMKRDELRSRFEEIVELPGGSLDETTLLSDIELWDSVAMMSFIALADEGSGTKLSARDIRNCQTVRDLLDLTGIRN